MEDGIVQNKSSWKKLYLRRHLNLKVRTVKYYVTNLLEEERHKAFQLLRKKHYEMKDAIKLGHQLEEEEDEDDDGAKTRDKSTMVNGHTS